jgi:hypothetical protein
MKEAFRVKIKHSLRQLSKNMAKKLAIAWAILWNFYIILIYVFLFILLVLIFRRYFFDFWNSLHTFAVQAKRNMGKYNIRI